MSILLQNIITDSLNQSQIKNVVLNSASTYSGIPRECVKLTANGRRSVYGNLTVDFTLAVWPSDYSAEILQRSLNNGTFITSLKNTDPVFAQAIILVAASSGSTPDSSSSSSNTAIIVGSVVGGVVFLALVAVAAVTVRSRRTSQTVRDIGQSRQPALVATLF
jgi:hypothetical protein